jgi:hypothetical protein
MGFAGIPTAVQFLGNDFETTAPAPTTVFSPIDIWLIIFAPVPTYTQGSIVTSPEILTDGIIELKLDMIES